MGVWYPFLKTIGDFLLCFKAQNANHIIRNFYMINRNIPFPGSGTGGIYHHFQFAFTFLKLLLRQFSFGDVFFNGKIFNRFFVFIKDGLAFDVDPVRLPAFAVIEGLRFKGFVVGKLLFHEGNGFGAGVFPLQQFSRFLPYDLFKCIFRQI